MQHFLPHPNVLTPNGAAYDSDSRFARDAASCAWRDRTVDDRKTGLISSNIFYYLTHEVLVAEGETNVHDVATVKRRGQINIHSENFMPRLNDFKQRFAYFAKTNDDYCLAHLCQFPITPESI
jgi:hypothetical protein